MSKGSWQRPHDKAKFDEGYARIFGGKKMKKKPYETTKSVEGWVYDTESLKDQAEGEMQFMIFQASIALVDDKDALESSKALGCKLGNPIKRRITVTVKVEDV